MGLGENDFLGEQSASYLRTRLIAEIQEFIRWLELKLPIEQLTGKRDSIRYLIEVLDQKENAEFDQIVGKYFPDFSP
jgi:hypothetical protein